MGNEEGCCREAEVTERFRKVQDFCGQEGQAGCCEEEYQGSEEGVDFPFVLWGWKMS